MKLKDALPKFYDELTALIGQRSADLIESFEILNRDDVHEKLRKLLKRYSAIFARLEARGT
jgi:hypothetical protein